jgi:DNA-binding transcriptional regulator YhcF (GntR family)
MDKLSSENKFAIMPEWVIELDISHTAFRLYAVLARYADNVTHQAFPSLDTLAERLSCSEKTVRRAIDDLVEHGAITKHNRGRYNSNLYTVMISPPEGTNMSSEGTKVSEEGTKMSQRVDKNVQVTRTTELEPKNYITKKAQQLPTDWKPSPDFADECAKKFPTLIIANEVEAFIDYHTANGSVFKDFQAAFRTWCRNAVKFQAPKMVVHQQALKPPAESPGRRDWVRTMHDMGEHFECKEGEFGCK